MNNGKTAALVVLGGIAAGFGAYAVSQGHNGNVITAVFTFLGVLGGYIASKA